MEQANAAYQQTADHLDTAVRAANPGMEHPPAMSFEQIVHSIYMTAILQLGGATKPGEQPKIDLMGARQSIDMLAILAEKTKGNLTPAESQLMDNALFEIRMGFLEVTQALARSAANRQPPPPGARPAAPPSSARDQCKQPSPFSAAAPRWESPRWDATAPFASPRSRPRPAFPRPLRAIAAPAPPSSSAGKATTSSSTLAQTSTPRPLPPASTASTPSSTPTATPTTSSAWTTSAPSAFTRPATFPSTPTSRPPSPSSASSTTPSAPSTVIPPAPASPCIASPPPPARRSTLFGARFLRVPVTHGRQTISGFRFGSAAYLTDLSDLPPESVPLLNLDLLILDALRREPHPTHSTLDNSITLVERLKPRRAFFTHISHGLDHDSTNALLPPHIRLAYDGLQLTFDI